MAPSPDGEVSKKGYMDVSSFATRKLLHIYMHSLEPLSEANHEQKHIYVDGRTVK